jgi:hypothetical protein
MTDLYTKRFFRCPNCNGQEFAVEHLMGKHTKAGPWGCDDCGQAWWVEIKGEAVEATRAPQHDYGPHVAVILEIPPQKEPIRFKLHARQYSLERTNEEARFLYEEHTCPTNWLGEVTDLYLGEDPDPHHIIRFVESRPFTPEEMAELEHGNGPVALDGAPGLNLEREREEAKGRPQLMIDERTAGGAPLDPEEAALLAALRARGLNELAEMALWCFGESYGHAPTALRELRAFDRVYVVGAGGGAGSGGGAAGGGSREDLAFASTGGIGGGGGGSSHGCVASGGPGGNGYVTPFGGWIGGGGAGVGNDPFVVAARRLNEQQRRQATERVQALHNEAWREFSTQLSTDSRAIGPQMVEAWYRERGVVVRAEIHPDDPKNVVVDPIRLLGGSDAEKTQ